MASSTLIESSIRYRSGYGSWWYLPRMLLACSMLHSRSDLRDNPLQERRSPVTETMNISNTTIFPYTCWACKIAARHNVGSQKIEIFRKNSAVLTNCIYVRANFIQLRCQAFCCSSVCRSAVCTSEYLSAKSNPAPSASTHGHINRSQRMT